MLLIGTPLVVTRWRNLIHSWRYWQCYIWSCCGPHSLPLFSKWRSWFNKYRAGGMKCAALLNFTINDSFFVEVYASCILTSQDVCFHFGRNNLREWVCMYHPRHVLCSTSFPPTISFLMDGGSSSSRGYDGCSGHNSV